jgi:MFS family permease
MASTVEGTASEADAAVDQSGQRASVGAWWGLAVLLMIGLYTFMDRQIFGLQAEPIRQALGLNDFQFGLLQGISVALFAMLVGYPIAWLSDRYDRRLVLAGCIAVWSLSVGACGLSRDFNELFLASALVGAGEAGLLPIVYALIPELFRGPQRQLANSLLMVTSRLAVGLVIAACGWMIVSIDGWRPHLPEALQTLPTWRLAFFATALPGLLIVPLVLWLPIARRADAAQRSAAQAAGAVKASVLRFVRQQRVTCISFSLSVGLLVFGFGASGAFIPVVAARQMGATPVEIGNAMGIATFVAALVGLLFANVGMKAMAGRFGAGMAVQILMLSALLSGLSAIPLYFATTPTQLFAAMALHHTFLMAGAMSFPTALQDLSPAPIRARMVAIVITVNMVLGSLSPAVVGAISDALKPRADSLTLAMVATATVALLASAALMAFCSRTYVATIAAARESERLAAA